MNPTKQLRIVEQRELVIATACTNLARELRSLDPTTYALFFNTGNMSAIYDAITEMIERHFARGTMNFSCTGECVVSWDEPPVISIDLEFEKEDVFAFFRLYFGNRGTAASLHHISFGESAGDPEANTRLLEKQMDQASIPSVR